MAQPARDTSLVYHQENMIKLHARVDWGFLSFSEQLTNGKVTANELNLLPGWWYKAVF